MPENFKIAAGITLFLTAIVLIIFWPFVTIWAINTIAPAMSIPYSFWTWLAVIVMQMSTFGGLHTTIRSLKN